ncbi:MAG: hypothetical protein RLZZ308_463 [Candidatus Parcubacteria bacterium]|jgi:ribosomal-protein-serine acetyltransferase
MNFEIKINEKLSLKLRHEEDVENVFSLVDKNREYLRLWLPWVDSTLSQDDSRLYIQKCLDGFKEKKTADFGIFYNNTLVGSMGFNKIDLENFWAEIGYWLDEDFQGKGIMTECVKSMIGYGFNDLELHRIQIRCDSNNTKSKMIPEKLGLKLEGIIRENHKNGSTYSDGLIYGILKNEWKPE